jgi:hypothetical protein
LERGYTYNGNHRVKQGGTTLIYHVTLAFTEYEYYRVEADSEEEAKEKILEGTEEQYNWDRTYEGVEVEPVN